MTTVPRSRVGRCFLCVLLVGGLAHLSTSLARAQGTCDPPDCPAPPYWPLKNLKIKLTPKTKVYDKLEDVPCGGYGGCVVRDPEEFGYQKCEDGRAVPREYTYGMTVHMLKKWKDMGDTRAKCNKKACSRNQTAPCKVFTFCMMHAHECGHVEFNAMAVELAYYLYVLEISDICGDCETKESEAFTKFYMRMVALTVDRTGPTEHAACKAGCDYHLDECFPP